MWRRLDTRIVVLFLTLLLLIQLASFAVVRTFIARSAEGVVAADLATAEKVLRRLLDQKATRLTESAKLLAADYGFRDAIATSDSETISDALLNQANRIGASGALFADARFTLKAATGDDGARFLPAARALASASRGQDGARVVLDDARANLIVAVPIRAPVLVGWIALRFAIGRTLLEDLLSLTNVEGSILIRDSAWAPWQVQETLAADDKARELARLVLAEAAGPRSVTLGSGRPGAGANPQGLGGQGDTYVMQQSPLAEDGGRKAIVALALSTSKATAPYRHLQSQLLVLTAVGAVLFAIGSWFTARRVTRPIKQLTRSAERLGAGDYDVVIEAGGKDEVGELARRFEHMRVDIRERDQRISRLAFWDELTGMPNRAQFVDRLTAAIAEAAAGETPLSVLMLDVDRFKQINDVLGHAFGDRLLKVLAERLRSDAVRPQDFVARLGGDEFGLMLPGADRELAERVAHRIRGALDRPVKLDDQTVDLGAGIGVACVPMHGTTAAQVLMHAEAAMYSAKARASGVVVFDSSLDVSSSRTLSLLTELRGAIERGELELHLQPKVGLATGRICGAEALVRWRHPERGMIPPTQFVPFLEQTGQIRMLTHWALQRAAATWCQLRDRGRAMPIAVNLSPRDLIDQDLPLKLEKLIAGYRLGPGALSLEITESATMDDPQRAMQTLARLDAMGIELSIDDFGTGYSSLAYLKKLPVRNLKIDRSFVMNMEKDAADAQIVRSTIDLAHNLGLSVVAEGVETTRSWSMLRHWRCDDAQGYLIARPMPLADFQTWAEGWHMPQVEPFETAEKVPRLSVV
ncbi:MAG: EAL domain-containing protein [Burkholderiaceae bacterium]